MRRSLVTTAAALVAFSMLQACSSVWNSNPYRAKTTMTQTVDHVADASLRVDTRNGRIDVAAETSRQDVWIEAHITAVGKTQQEADDRLAATVLDVSRDGANKLIIRPIFPDEPRGSDGAAITVRLPDANGAYLESSNGSVKVVGLTGDLIIDTSNGGINLRDHYGSAVADTSNGNVTVHAHRGELEVDTSNGRVDVVELAGPAKIDTSNGSVNVSLAPDQRGPLRVDSSNGSIVVTVGPAFEGEVVFDTSNGAIHIANNGGNVISSNISRSSGRIVVGSDNAAQSRLDTSNGSIRFTIDG